MSIFFPKGPKCELCGEGHHTHEHTGSLPKVHNNIGTKEVKSDKGMHMPEHTQDYLGIPEHWHKVYKRHDEKERKYPEEHETY